MDSVSNIVSDIHPDDNGHLNVNNDNLADHENHAVVISLNLNSPELADVLPIIFSYIDDASTYGNISLVCQEYHKLAKKVHPGAYRKFCNAFIAAVEDQFDYLETMIPDIRSKYWGTSLQLHPLMTWTFMKRYNHIKWDLNSFACQPNATMRFFLENPGVRPKKVRSWHITKETAPQLPCFKRAKFISEFVDTDFEHVICPAIGDRYMIHARTPNFYEWYVG